MIEKTYIPNVKLSKKSRSKTYKNMFKIKFTDQRLGEVVEVKQKINICFICAKVSPRAKVTLMQKSRRVKLCTCAKVTLVQKSRRAKVSPCANVTLRAKVTRSR